MHPLPHPGSPSRLLSLGEVALPFPPRRNVRAAAAGAATLALAREAQVLPQKLEPYFDEFTDLAAQFYPAATQEGLVLGGLLVSWLFFLDDSYDRDAKFASDPAQVRALMERTLALLEGESPSPTENLTPLQRYTVLFHERLGAAKPEWVRRFMQSVRDYLFKGSLPVVESWQAERFPDLETYSARRVHDSGVLPCIDLLEPLGGYMLPDALLQGHALQRMRTLCARVIAHENDIVSYENEVLQRDMPNNLVRLYMHHQKLSFALAVSATVESIQEDLHRFAWLKERLLKTAGADAEVLEDYALGMECLMRGNHDWSLTSRRYASPTSPFPELRRPR